MLYADAFNCNRILRVYVLGRSNTLVWKFLTGDEFRRVQGELLSLAASARFLIVLPIPYPLFSSLSLKIDRSDDVFAPKDTRVSPTVVKESNVTLVSSSLEFPSNDVPFLHVVALGKNKEWLNTMVDTPDNKMADGVVNDKSRDVFVKVVSHTVSEDDGSSLAQGPKRVSFSPNDVVVALFVGEKDNGSSSPRFPVTASYTAEEVVATPFGVLY
nr:hypothetical protein [Tanacetum cinerariifolium]